MVRLTVGDLMFKTKELTEDVVTIFDQFINFVKGGFRMGFCYHFKFEDRSKQVVVEVPIVVLLVVGFCLPVLVLGGIFLTYVMRGRLVLVKCKAHDAKW